jgi:hypothetical protein
MSQTGRVPLWLIATIGGIGLITVMGLFFLWFLFRNRFHINKK